ncbi:MAG: YggS family pyridoxal phosphate-dependent enzyme [Candidatus Margulisiibacteriota bacterium]
MSGVRTNIRSVRDEISRACERIGRDPADVTLMAVTKGESIDTIKEAIDEGIRHLGESKVQEALNKIPVFSGNNDLTWYMIGHLQTNKMKQALSLFGEIHSVDSLNLAHKINETVKDSGKIIPIYIEINISGEQSKYGLSPSMLRSFLSSAQFFSGIKIEGLMTLAPFSKNPEESRPYFKELARLAGANGLKGLCMGMSGDFIVAIEEGATIIRVGRAIFKESPE